MKKPDETSARRAHTNLVVKPTTSLGPYFVGRGRSYAISTSSKLWWISPEEKHYSRLIAKKPSSGAHNAAGSKTFSPACAPTAQSTIFGKQYVPASSLEPSGASTHFECFSQHGVTPSHFDGGSRSGKPARTYRTKDKSVTKENHHVAAQEAQTQNAHRRFWEETHRPSTQMFRPSQHADVLRHAPPSSAQPRGAAWAAAASKYRERITQTPRIVGRERTRGGERCARNGAAGCGWRLRGVEAGGITWQFCVRFSRPLCVLARLQGWQLGWRERAGGNAECGPVHDTHCCTMQF